MAAIETLVQAADAGGATEAQLASLMADCLGDPDVQAACRQLDQPALDTATVAALYTGHRSVHLGEYGGWYLSVSSVREASDYIASPTSRSIIFCVEASRPVLFETYVDDADYRTDDLRPDLPIRLISRRLVGEGEIVRSLRYDEWSALSGTVDATFLKLETATERPVTVAFSRDTLRPVSMGFADHRHTGNHFLSMLMLHLVGDDEAIQRCMETEERRAFREYLERAATNAETHLLTRWKYVQALGRIDGAAAREALEAIGAYSRSAIGVAARKQLAAATAT